MERFWTMLGLVPNPMKLAEAPLWAKIALAAYFGVCFFVNWFMEPVLWLEIFFTWIPIGVGVFYVVFLLSLPLLMRLKARSRRIGGAR